MRTVWSSLTLLGLLSCANRAPSPHRASPECRPATCAPDTILPLADGKSWPGSLPTWTPSPTQARAARNGLEATLLAHCAPNLSRARRGLDHYWCAYRGITGERDFIDIRCACRAEQPCDRSNEVFGGGDCFLRGLSDAAGNIAYLTVNEDSASPVCAEFMSDEYRSSLPSPIELPGDIRH